MIVMNLGKLVGLGIAVNEAVIRAEARNSVILMCIVFVLGVQAVEIVLLRAVDRMFGESSR